MGKKAVGRARRTGFFFSWPKVSIFFHSRLNWTLNCNSITMELPIGDNGVAVTITDRN